jgi:hypothetical protein
MRETPRIRLHARVASAVYRSARTPALAGLPALVPFVVALASLGCRSPRTETHAPPQAAEAPSAEAPSEAPSLRAVDASRAESPPSGTPCGPLACAQYDDPRTAFLATLTSQPLALGVGEAHAPVRMPHGDGGAVLSAADRFTRDFLPLLAPRASDLLVELMFPPAGCVDAAAEVRRAQAPVLAKEAPTNQNEYVAMGERARALGIVPDGLRPTCADMSAIASAGDDAIGVELETIARLAAAQAKKLVARAAASPEDRGKMVILYGGALHNAIDGAVTANAGGETTLRWSYAPAVDAEVLGRFVAVDLIVPEFIRDDAPWRALPWWPYYDRDRLGGKTTLFRLGEKTYVLVFPKSAP